MTPLYILFPSFQVGLDSIEHQIYGMSAPPGVRSGRQMLEGGGADICATTSVYSQALSSRTKSRDNEDRNKAWEKGQQKRSRRHDLREERV